MRVLAGNRAETLNDSLFRDLGFALLERHHLKTAPGHLKQLAGIEKERGRGRAAEPLVAARERLIDQHAARIQQVRQDGQQRPVQIIGDDDGGEPPPRRQRPRAAVLKVCLDKIDTGLASKIGHAAKVAVDPCHRMAGLGEQAEVTATAAGDIEHCTAWGHQRREAAYPRGRFTGRFEGVVHSDAFTPPFVLVY
jgi:hypothetical protein